MNVTSNSSELTWDDAGPLGFLLQMLSSWHCFRSQQKREAGLLGRAIVTELGIRPGPVGRTGFTLEKGMQKRPSPQSSGPGRFQNLGVILSSSLPQTELPLTPFFFFFFFLVLKVWHMEVPRPGLIRSYSHEPTPQPQQCRI